MVRLEGETSNTLLDTLEDWNSYLEAEKIDFSKIVQKAETDKPTVHKLDAAVGSMPPSRETRRRTRGPSL